MDRGYVSEFTLFMNKFLKDHPEVVEDQQRGWSIYWAPKIEPKMSEACEEEQSGGVGR